MWNPSDKPYLHHSSSVFSTSQFSKGETVTPISISCYQKYGLKPSIIRHVARVSPTVTYFRDCFEKYYLLYWSREYLLKQLEGGVILHQDTEYIPCFSSSLNRGKILDAMAGTQFAISFRKPFADTGVAAYCWIGTQADKQAF